MSGENSYLITADGRRFPLAGYGVEIADLGSAPVEYETSRGYGQHGVTVHDWRLAERVISFTLSGSGRNRARYWALREQIIGALRPNRAAPSRCVLCCRAARGATFAAGCNPGRS